MFPSCKLINQITINHEMKITSMEIIRYDMRKLPLLPHKHSDSYCGLFKISCGAIHGFAEFNLPRGSEPADLVKWATVFGGLKGLEPKQAIHYITEHQCLWGEVRAHFLLKCLDNLIFNLDNCGNLPMSQEQVRAFLMEYALTYYSF